MSERRMTISQATFDTLLTVNRCGDREVLLVLSTPVEEGTVGAPKDRKAWTVSLSGDTDFTSDEVGDFLARVVHNSGDGDPTWTVSRCSKSGGPLNTQVIRWDEARNDISFL